MKNPILACSVLLVASILVSFPSLTAGTLWWDEAVYLGLAENVQTNGIYSLDVTAKVVDNFRPPAFPLLLVVVQSIFGQSAVHYINPAITICVALSLFFIGTRMYSETAGILASLFVITNSQYVFWNSKILSEPLAILVSAWTLFATYLVFGERKTHYYIILFPLLSAAFLTRYPLAALGIVALIYALAMRGKKLADDIKNRYAWVGLLLGVAVLIPWFVYNHTTYGNILGSVLTNFAVVQQYSDSAWIYVTRFLPNLQVLGVVSLIAIAYTLVTKDKRDVLSATFIIVCFATFAFVLGQKDFRYTVVTLPAMALLAASFVEKIDRILEAKRVISFLVAALIISLSLPAGYQQAMESKEIGDSPQQAANYIAERIPENTSIMTKHYPVFAYITKRHVVDFPKSPREIDIYLRQHNVSYVVIDTVEHYPLWAIEHFQHHTQFKVEKVFTDERHNATVYGKAK